LAEIWAYLTEEASETVATRFVASVEAKFSPLLQSPLIGSPRDQFAAGLRAIFRTPYVIYYLAAAHELIIVRVPHSARDWRTDLDVRKLAPGSIRRKMSAPSSLYEFLTDKNAVAANPIKGVKRPKVDS
jgi:plasmid stabilization system protein ParE